MSAAPIQISLEELQSIRRMASAPGHSSGGSSSELGEAALRAERRARSVARSSQWPNTLAGLRRGKEAAKAASQAAADREAEAMDAAIAEERLAERLSILKAANAYFAGQSDKVKALRTFQQRRQDMEANQANAQLRARRAGEEAAEDSAYHHSIMAQVAEGDASEAHGRATQRVRAREVAEGLTAQVREAYAARARESQAEVERAQEVVRDAARMQAEAEAAAQDKLRHVAQANREFAAENARLAAMRLDAGAAEAVVDGRVLQETRRQEDKVAKIKGILAAQKTEADRKAKVISDLMAKDYLSRQSSEDARVSAAVAEAEASTQAAAAAKLAAQESMKRSINEHIAAQRHRMVSARRAELAEAHADHAVFSTKLAQLDAQEAGDVAGARARAVDVRRAQLAQMADKKRTLESWRAVDATEALAADSAARGGPQDVVFNAQAQALLEAEVGARGSKAAAPVLRLVHKLKNPTLMPNLRRM